MKKHIVVIGSGPGGYPAVVRAAKLGADVTVIEKGAVGGVCLNCGCIPSKTLLSAAHSFDALKKIAALADGEVPPVKPSWAKIIARKNAVVTKLQRGVELLFKAGKINFIEGAASFVSDKEIMVDGQKIAFDYAIIATGTEPFFPHPLAAYREHFLDNKTVFEMPNLPASITIVGGGVIGCEFSCIFAALGVRVSIVELKGSLLPGEEGALARALTSSLTKMGVKIYTNVQTEKVEISGGKKILHLSDGTALESDEVLVAVGRESMIEDLGLENLNIEFDRKRIKVDPQTLQAAPNIYAVGDVNGLCLLAHAATRQGETAAERIMGNPALYDNDAVPKAIYTWPEVATVGLNKQTAEERGYEVKVQKSFLLANGRALAQEESEGFLQLVSDAKTGRVLGAQIAGSYASEIIHIAAMAIQAKMTVGDLKQVVFAHPTIAESFIEAAHK